MGGDKAHAERALSWLIKYGGELNHKGGSVSQRDENLNKFAHIVSCYTAAKVKRPSVGLGNCVLEHELGKLEVWNMKAHSG